MIVTFLSQDSSEELCRDAAEALFTAVKHVETETTKAIVAFSHGMEHLASIGLQSLALKYHKSMLCCERPDMPELARFRDHLR